LSARAAAQLEWLGFSQVYRYTRGKADWIVRGLPAEPPAPATARIRALPYFVDNLAPAVRRNWIRLSHRKRVSDSMTSDLPRLRPDDLLPESFARSLAPVAVVIDDTGILLGAIDQNQPGVSAREAMNPAPQTIRPDMTHRLASSLLRHSPYLLITTADGRYLGRYAG
jgi:hypothetical protein